MDFFLGNRPDFSAASPEDVARWTEQQFVQLAESLQQSVGSVDLYPRASIPDRYGDGTICNLDFTPNLAMAPNGYTTPGLYVFRNSDNAWHRLVEE